VPVEEKIGGKAMHWIAGVLLVADFVLMWILDKTVALKGLDYVAIATWLVAIVLISLPMLALRRKGQVPPGESFVSTEALVDIGIYALVRHPLYLGWMLMYLVVLLFNPNWILAGVGILGVACVYGFTRQEEQLLIARFGESYRHYMQRVPRFNLPAGIIRLLGDRGRS
jgi:protein-S-isoprenylcysteine O-methyltransferase Ste14